MSHLITAKDVVRIKKGLPGKTGVVVRIDHESASVVIKGNDFGTWFNIRELKRIGRIK